MNPANVELVGVEPVNPMPDGTCRTIKNQYQFTSACNMLRTGTFGATGVVKADYSHTDDISYCLDANYWKGTTIDGFLEKHRRQLVIEGRDQIPVSMTKLSIESVDEMKLLIQFVQEIIRVLVADQQV